MYKTEQQTCPYCGLELKKNRKGYHCTYCGAFVSDWELNKKKIIDDME